MVDSYRFLDPLTQQVVKTWIARESARPIPWTPWPKPLAECTVALVGSAGIALRTDPPFNQEGERQNPWWGDPSYRMLPRTATEKDVGIYHLHINPRFAMQDLNCIFPLQRLLELEAEDVIGRSAPRHYSFMGYTLQPRVLLEETTPSIIRRMKEDGVDVALLVPV